MTTNPLLMRSEASRALDVHELSCDAQGSVYLQRWMPPGVWSIGWFGVLADEAAGRPLAQCIPPGAHCPTQSIHFDLVRPPTAMPGQEVTARGAVIRVGDSVALTSFTLLAADGDALVLGTMRNALLPASLPLKAPEPTTATTLTAADGLGSFLGTNVEEQLEGQVLLSWTPQPRHSNPVGTVHGGIHAALADHALSSAVRSTRGREAWTLLGLGVSYHRPLPVDQGALTIAAKVLRSGRRSAVAEVTVRVADGAVATTARGTFVPAA